MTRTCAEHKTTCDDPRVIISEYWRSICDCSLRLESFQLDGLDLPDFVSDSYDSVLGFSIISCDAVLVTHISKESPCLVHGR